MTIPRLTAYRDYWGRNPPVHLLAAAWMGFKPSSGKAVKANQPVTLPELDE